MNKKEPTLQEMCEDYKLYRSAEGKKLSKMTEEEQIAYYMNKQKEAKEMAEKSKMKTISFEEIFDEGDN